MSHKDLNTSVSIPLLLIIVGTLLGYLLTHFENVEKFLISYLQYKLAAWSLIASGFLLITLIPYYFFNRSVKPLNKNERDVLLKNIRDMVKSQYSLHRKNVLAKNFDEMLNKEAARGFNRPTGTFAGAISDLYVLDISVFSKLLEDAISKVTSKINNKTLNEDLSVLINEMLTKHNSDIKVLFCSFIKSYYQNIEQEHINAMNTNFVFQADTETKQRIKYLLSVNNLDKIT
jgi:hypothetical protein